MSIALKNTVATAWEYIKAGADWVWSRFWREISCFLIGILLGLLIMSAHTDKMVEKVSSEYEAQIAAAEVVAEKEATAGQIWSQHNQDYMALARMIGGVRERYNLSDDACRALIDICTNRKNANYDVFANDNTYKEVVEHEGQFENVKAEGIYTKSDYELCKSYLESSSGRILTSDKFFWVKMDQGYIIAMDYDALTTGNGNTQKVE